MLELGHPCHELARIAMTPAQSEKTQKPRGEKKMQLYPKMMFYQTYKHYFSCNINITLHTNSTSLRQKHLLGGDILLTALSTASSQRLCPKNGFLTYATVPEIHI